MALPKREIDIPFGVVGMDAGKNSKLVRPPNLLEVRNGDMTLDGQITKRNGYTDANTDGWAPTKYDRFALRENNLCLLDLDSAAVWEYSEAAQDLIEHGPEVHTTDDFLFSVTTGARALIGSKSTEYVCTDTAVMNGFLFLAARDEDNTENRVFVFDLSSYTKIAEHALPDDPEYLRLVALPKGESGESYDIIGIVYIRDPGGGEVCYWDTLRSTDDYTTLQGEATLTTAAHTSHNFDVVETKNDAGFVVAFRNGSSKVEAYLFDHDGTQKDTEVLSAGTPDTDGGICCFRTRDYAVILVGWSDTSSDVTAGTVSYTTGVSWTLTKLNEVSIWGAALATKRLCGAYDANDDNFYLFYEEPDADPLRTILHWSRVDPSTGAKTGTNGFLYGGQLVHGGVGGLSAGYEDWPTIGILRKSDYDPIYMEMAFTTIAGVPAGKYRYLTAGDVHSIQAVPRAVYDDDTEKYYWGCSIANKVFTEDNEIQILQSLGVAHFERDNSDALQSVQYGRNLIISGSMPRLYDGAHVAELGFSCTAEIESAASASGGSLADGTYEYIAIYEYMDANGNYYRSQPGQPLSVTVTGGPKKVTVEVYSAPVAWHSDPFYVTVGLYRSVAGGAGLVHYRVNDYSGGAKTYISDVAHGDRISIEDTLADSSITDRETLYTDAGLLANYAPPPCNWLAVHQNRLWAISSENGDLWYSKQKIDGEGPGFNLQLVIENHKEHIPVAAMSMANALAVFFEDAIAVVFGEGPNDQGQGGTYTELQFLEGNIGCINPRSVVSTPVGIMFEGRKGIYLLPPDYSKPVFIGEPILGVLDNSEDQTRHIIGADLMRDISQVRFTYWGSISEGVEHPKILVYNYEKGRWHFYAPEVTTAGDSYRIEESIVFQGVHYLMSHTLYLIWRQETDVWRDYTKADDYYYYDVVVKTPWLNMAGLQGLQRAWKAWILGEKIDQHDLKVEMYFNYIESSPETRTHDWTDLNALTTYQVRNDIRKQKCTAIMFVITIDTDTDSVDKEGARLNGIRLSYGIKRGSSRVPAEGRA